MARLKGALDLNLLPLLVALHETRSIEDTADRLQVSPHAVRTGLAELRRYFADRLFVGPQLSPTPNGAALCEAIAACMRMLSERLAELTWSPPDRLSRRMFDESIAS
jgi:DNA-binding transcriptional LysR family regulator